jgi:chromosome segregation ATPase
MSLSDERLAQIRERQDHWVYRSDEAMADVLDLLIEVDRLRELPAWRSWNAMQETIRSLEREREEALAQVKTLTGGAESLCERRRQVAATGDEARQRCSRGFPRVRNPRCGRRRRRVSDDVRASLHRLKRRVGREGARYVRIYNDKYERTGSYDERAFGEANVCETVMRFIDEELAKLAPALPDPKAAE